MKLSMPPEVISQQDLKGLISEVQQYAKWFAHTSVKMRYDKAAGNDDQPAVSPAATQLLNDRAGDGQLTQKSLDELISELKYLEAQTAYLTIILAAPVSNKLKQTLSDWCRTNIDPNILVNFKFNGTILGGMVMVHKSRIFDWSFRRQILSNRAKFPEILRNV